MHLFRYLARLGDDELIPGQDACLRVMHLSHHWAQSNISLDRTAQGIIQRIVWLLDLQAIFVICRCLSLCWRLTLAGKFSGLFIILNAQPCTAINRQVLEFLCISIVHLDVFHHMCLMVLQTATPQ